MMLQEIGRWVDGSPSAFQHFQNATLTQLPGNAKKLRNSSCMAMILENLAHPFWTKISCSAKLQETLFCSVREPTLQTCVTYGICGTKNKQPIGLKLNTQSCGPHHILQNKTCYHFKWLSVRVSNLVHLPKLCKGTGNTSSIHPAGKFLFILKSTSLQSLTVLNMSSQKYLHRIVYEKELNTYRTEVKKIKQGDASGFFACEVQAQKEKVGLNVVELENRRYLSSYILYQRILDHTHGHTGKPRKFCKNLCPKDKQLVHKLEALSRIVCHGLVYRNGIKLCHIVLTFDSVINMKPEDNTILHCNNNHRCLKESILSKCDHPFQIPCTPDKTECYNISDICTYRLSEHNYLIPCRAGGHLQSCEDFQCNAMFKCPMSYCIPWAYVCDNKWDCPNGDDENYAPVCNGSCTSMFKCQNTDHVCLELRAVCDGIPDCPLMDDEFLCVLHRTQCPNECVCLALGIRCSGVAFVLTAGNLPFIFVHISNTKSLQVKTLFTHVFSRPLIVLFLNCSISAVCQRLSNNYTSFIDLSDNNIFEMTKHCFYLPMINTLLLDRNKIQVLKSHFIDNLRKLQFLSLSDNPVTILPDGAFAHAEIKVLKLEFISFQKIQFSDLKMH